MRPPWDLFSDVFRKLPSNTKLLIDQWWRTNRSGKFLPVRDEMWVVLTELLDRGPPDE
jgi:hypothetical protein